MLKLNKWLVILLSSLLLLSCSSKKNVSGKVINKKGHASYYADKFNGRKTASGERFSNRKLTAAHRKLAFGTKLKVTNVANKKSVIVTVNDRGPFIKSRDIDLSKEAFMQITDNKNHGVLTVIIEIIK
ncbi:septal ring lytic transglycosylase RlpA family protein [Flavobacterium tegetincola]|uniref:septal ring lytic transglycosylase RlpA family protein n=1 Tax=Flavobacterium tegetincola TaxID=150172 RepID=UPI00041CE9AF|nr:septal ring lytic transglycosylase RlpA family protein [Flavobacterium tegetincola]